MAKVRYFKCNVCGKIVAVINDTPTDLICCGTKMDELKGDKKDDFILEKHVPVYEKRKNKVKVSVGSVIHPSNYVHYIEWVALKTNKGYQIKMLKPGETPIVSFILDEDEEIEEISSYCNIHSLYSTTFVEANNVDEDDCGCDIKL